MQEVDRSTYYTEKHTSHGYTTMGNTEGLEKNLRSCQSDLLGARSHTTNTNNIPS